MKTIARCRLVSIPLAALAVCLGFFGADGPARANDDLPRDTKQIETLTPDQARKLVADFNGTLLVLDGLTILDVETAKALASYGGDVLVLGGLTALDSEVARALAGFKGRMLALNGLRTLNAATAGAIATFKGDVIALNGLKAIDDEAAAALAGFEGKMLAMNGLTKRGGKLRRDVSPTRAGGRKPRITISKETTRIEGPVDLDGYVDYVAAYHQRAGRGLSPDTNAAVLMIRAIGSNGIPEDARVDYFDTLGIPPLPEKGPYLVSLDEYFDHIHNKAGEEPNEDDREQLWVSLEQSMTRPWSKREFPVLAQWLEVNDRPLSLVVEATKRPRWYEPPVLDGNQLLIGANFPLVFASREVARALTIRATLRLHSGQIEQAWDDMLACHRLARLMAQGMTLIEALTAVAIETTVCSADQAMLGGAVLTAAQARRMYNDLKKWHRYPRSKKPSTLVSDSCFSMGFTPLRFGGRERWLVL